jgi:glutathione S-transferase
MKLFYFPGACSLAAHIALCEAELPFEAVRVDLATKKTADGGDFLNINPKGYVPALQLDDGQVLTEDQVLLQYIADRQPESGLTPAAGTLERYRLMEWLAFIATEIHKGFGPLWNPATPAGARDHATALLGRRFGFLQERLARTPWLMGAEYTVADAYLFTVLNWTGLHRIDLSPWPALVGFMARAGERPAVRKALKEEGLA